MDQVKKTAFKLIGLRLSNKTTNKKGQSNIDCANLWQKFEKENIAKQVLNKVSDEIYAVYFDYEGDHTSPFSYFIGCNVGLNTEAPAGMDELIIPKQLYKKVLAKGRMPECISHSWESIWSSTINRSYKYDFEVYGEHSRDWSKAEVEIFVALEDSLKN